MEDDFDHGGVSKIDNLYYLINFHSGCGLLNKSTNFRCLACLFIFFRVVHEIIKSNNHVVCAADS